MSHSKINGCKANLNSVRAYSKSYRNEELDREIEIEVGNLLKTYSTNIFGCFTIDYYEDDSNDDNIKMNCGFCNKIYSTKGNLDYHKKNSKSCLKIQQEQNNCSIKIELKNCDFCNKSFSFKNLKVHIENCKDRKKSIEENQVEKEKNYEKIIEELKKENEIKNIEIEKLKRELEVKDAIYKDEHKTIKKIALQPHTTNNTNIIGNWKSSK